MNFNHHYATFALRRNEEVTFFKEMPSPPINGYLYTIMLRPTPPFPGPRYKSKETAVLCAQYGPEGWMWVNLEAVTKQLLGNHMMKARAAADRWYYFTVKEDRR